MMIMNILIINQLRGETLTTINDDTFYHLACYPFNQLSPRTFFICYQAGRSVGTSSPLKKLSVPTSVGLLVDDQPTTTSP